MYTFIVNPNARSGLGAQIWSEIETALQTRTCEYQVLKTKYQCHATKLVRELTADGERHTIIVLGGDGTINEVINGIQHLSKVTLGYIPLGSSNDFARGFALASKPEEALTYILNPRRHTYMDVGAIVTGDTKRRFAVSSGIGFDAGVCHQVAVSRLKLVLNKLKLGKLSYALIAIARLVKLTPKNMTISLDGGAPLEYRSVYFAALMNHQFEGGGFKFCPDADPGDGLLNLIIVSDMPKLKALLLLPTAFKGWHVHFKGVHTLTCKSADIISDIPLPIHTDGEPIIAQSHMAVHLEPKRLRIITQ